MGPAVLDDKNFIHLARRALYDPWDNETDPGKKDQYKTLGYDTYSEARQFFLSVIHYNDYRPLNGKIAEARLVRRPHSRTDLGKCTTSSKPEGRPDAFPVTGNSTTARAIR